MQLSDYLPILIYFAGGLAVAVAIFSLSKVVPEQAEPGEGAAVRERHPAVNPVRQRFSIDFYLTAMLFIVFDIELAFLYPIAVVLRDDGVLALVVLLVFVFTVVEALTYIWKKGALEWR